MEAFIHYIIKYNEKIIYALGGAICFLSAIVVWWQVFGKKGLKTEGAVDVDLSGIEESLKKILSQTDLAIGSVNAAVKDTGNAGAGASAVVLAGVVGLDGKPITDAVGVKKELEIRTKIIDELRAQVAEAKSQDASSELLAKIKALEGRLAEYEIIEDDIADLSVLKEENAKLKSELEGIRRASPQMLDQFAAEMAEADAKATPNVPNVETVPNVKAAPPDEDPMLAAVAAAQAQLNDTTATATATAEPIEGVAFGGAEAKAVEATPGSESTTKEEPVPEGDIFGEFSQGENSNEDPLSALGDIDPEKMLEELKDLNLESVGAEALDEAPDIDKMALEATALESEKG